MEKFDSERRARRQASINSEVSPSLSPRDRSLFADASLEKKEEASKTGGSIRRTFGSIKESVGGLKDKVLGKSTEKHSLQRQHHISDLTSKGFQGSTSIHDLSESSGDDSDHHRKRNHSTYDNTTKASDRIRNERLGSRNLDIDSDDDQFMARRDRRKHATDKYDSDLTSTRKTNEKLNSRNRSSKLSSSNSIHDWKAEKKHDANDGDSILFPQSRNQKDKSQKNKASSQKSSLLNRSSSRESHSNRDLADKPGLGRRNSKETKQGDWQSSPSPRRSSKSLFNSKDKDQLKSIDEPFKDESPRKRQLNKASKDPRVATDRRLKDRPKTATATSKPTSSALSPRKSRPISASSPRKGNKASINRSEDAFDFTTMKDSLDITNDDRSPRDVGPIDHYPFTTPINQTISQHDILQRTPSAAIRNSTEGHKTGTGQLLGVFEQIKAKRQENLLSMSQSGKDLLLKTQGSTGYFSNKSPRDIRTSDLANELAQTGQEYFSETARENRNNRSYPGSSTFMHEWRQKELQNDQFDGIDIYEEQYETSRAIRESVYEEWRKEKLLKEKKRLKAKLEGEKRKEAEERLKKEQQKAEAAKALVYWNEDKKNKLKAKQQEIKKINREKEEEELKKRRKKKDAEKYFRVWKEDKDVKIVEQQKKRLKEEKKKVREAEKAKKDKIKDSKVAFEAWSKKKDVLLQDQQKQKVKIERKKLKEEQQKREKKAKEASKAYDDWKSNVNYRPRKGSFTQASEREPWKPSGSLGRGKRQ
ncbi:Microtubule-associated protein 9 [Trichoplax sp. H2]|nr:Microtubule-associated protein 9 [Trichoplax sp. H2]|eukprot:RDD41652.1 Microtubule-associated protein 9 [Trichoplax sp. H2]